MPSNEYRYDDAAEGYASPTFDALKPQWQKFVLSWLKTMDYEQAAIDAGYVAHSAYDQGFRLARDPKIVAAIEELCDRRLSAVEQSRASVTHRLMLEATVSKDDLVEQVRADEVLEGNKGTQVLLRERIKNYDEIDPAWRVCLGMVSYTREGDVRFDTTAQNAARKLLATYMKWDREPADVAPPISFNFGALKPGVENETPPQPTDGYQTDQHAEKESGRSKKGRKTSKQLNGSAQ